MPRRVRLATLVAFCLHGFLVLTARYRLSFDAYTHMLLADHYRTNWWSLWDPRWYTGFSVTSYPPLVHQLIALLGQWIGVDAGFAVVLWAVLTAFPIATYAFSRVFVGRVAAGYAAMGAALLPSVYMAAHTFGQIPTLTATLFALFGLAALAKFLQVGDRHHGALAVALFSVVMAAHHATLLFLPWITIGLLIHLVLNGQAEWRILLQRISIFIPIAILAGLIVIWPFWAWGLGQTMQVPIDHLSRHNFITDPSAILVFFLPMYGLLMFLIPFALWSGRRRKFTGLAVAFLPLFILGLGGTTPLPRLLFGEGWEWLTYDRFAFWASFVLLPFFGVAMLNIRRYTSKERERHPAPAAANEKTKESAPTDRPRPAVRIRRQRVTLGIYSLLGLVAMTIGLLPSFVPFQPASLDMRPIVNFLAHDDRSRWRYLTFGFGDQLAYLSRLTSATTIDGSYHTARSLPELRTSGLPQIDVAFWTSKGVNALDPILQKSGSHGVRWGFVNLPAYVPVLVRDGWRKLTTLRNGVQVWENPAAIPPGPSPAPPFDPLASLSWGIFPLLSLALASILALLHFRPVPTTNVLFGIHRFMVGLLPVGLCFWYFLRVATNKVPNVYFVYTDGLLFLADILALLAVITWVLARYFAPGPVPSSGPQTSNRLQAPIDLKNIRNWLRVFSPWHFQNWLLALCILASLSVLWSTGWKTSLFVSLHLWLAFGLFLSLQDRPGVWRSAAYGFSAALVLQLFFGGWQFAAQSTDFMKPLGLSWPGLLDPATRGVSVVQLQDGTRWLRDYGTFPHPNILGVAIVAFLAGPVALLLSGQRRSWWIMILCLLASALLVVTFSRGAWIGLAAGAVTLLIHRARLDGRRLLELAIAAVLGCGGIAAPLYTLVITRVGGAAMGIATEQFSNEGRLWLVHVTMGMIRSHPLLGLGAGSYIIDYVRLAPRGYLIEPVHNLLLLIVAELGLGSGIILAGLGISILLGVLRARQPETIVFSAAVVGLLTTAMFDHSLWTLAPGGLLLAMMLGLWCGQIRREQQEQTACAPA